MPKRFSDSSKWDDPFFAGLSNNYKLLWIYMLDKCNHAGIFKVNKRLAEFSLDTKFDWKEVLKVFKGRIQTLNREKWFILKFIEYQYGVLQENNRVHNSIIQILKKEGVYKGCARAVIGSKDKDKEQDKDKDKEYPFNEIWEKYPNPVGKKDAIRHFNASVKTEQDWKDVNQALKNYTASDKVKKGFIMNGSTFFNNWQDYVNYKNPGPGAVKETKEKFDPNCRQKCNKGWHIVVKDGASGYRKCSCWRDR